MVDFRMEQEKLSHLYDELIQTVNDAIMIKFDYNGSNNSIYYTKKNNLMNNVLLVVDFNRIKYPLSIPIIKKNNDVNIGTWIPYEIYDSIKYIFKEWKPESLFEAAKDAINNNNPVVTTMVDTREKDFYKYKRNSNLPFFETFVRKNMSDDMKKRIYNSYTTQSKEIIRFCRKRGFTLRFTADINRSRNLLHEIELQESSSVKN